jgi:hypothetical protein
LVQAFARRSRQFAYTASLCGITPTSERWSEPERTLILAILATGSIRRSNGSRWRCERRHAFRAISRRDPVRQILGPETLQSLPPATRGRLTSRTFFPRLASAAFRRALSFAVGFAVIVCVVSALASLLRGPAYHSPNP